MLNDFKKIYSRNKRLNTISHYDFFDYVDKNTMFIEYVKWDKQNNTNYILLDDTVMDATLTMTYSNISIELVNIKQLNIVR